MYYCWDNSVGRFGVLLEGEHTDDPTLNVQHVGYNYDTSFATLLQSSRESSDCVLVIKVTPQRYSFSETCLAR